MLEYKTSIAISLTPVYHVDPPVYTLDFFGQKQVSGPLSKNEIIQQQFELREGNYSIDLFFHNKTNRDTRPGVDKAIKIDWIQINGITSKRFIWESTYHPEYPEPWKSQQQQKGIHLEPVLRSHDYLGWNGRWCLEFTAPVFTWIHHRENHGWIYD
jgi:hypothetical protein